MIDSISIENFRCFDKLKVKGFKSINLIGGQNNSGKTALLEALLLAFSPSFKSINVLRGFRNENGNLIKKANEKVWNHFFYNQDKTQIIKINTNIDSDKGATIELSCTNDIDTILKNTEAIGSSEEKLSELIIRKYFDIYFLNIKSQNAINTSNYYLVPDKEDGEIGFIGKATAAIMGLNAPYFLHSSYRLDDNTLSSFYSLTKQNKKIKVLNEILNILDNRIIGSEIDAPGGEPVIQLLLNDEQSFPLAMFGDAVRKITELVLILLNTTNKFLLIDEIENGIHFTKHRELWTKLFQIVGDDIQIFATTHSFEIIKAFNDVAHQSEFENKAMYFEMARTQKTHRLITNPIDMEMLKYKISFDRTFRGE